MLFHDRAILDLATKRLVSMRDGVLEYLGHEIGREPADQTFYVYRPPSALANASRSMDGLPIVDGHIDPEGEPPQTESYILDTQVVELAKQETETTLACSHRASVGQDLQAAIESGKREVSLGYTADLVDTERGIEQINIQPHHLAAETEGRCGPSCSFMDHRKPVTDGDMSMFGKKKGENSIHQAFLDQEGQVNMQQIVEIAGALPDAIKKIPVDKLQEVMPQLKELVQLAKENDPDMAQEDMEEEKYDSEGNPTTDKAKARAYEKIKDQKPQTQGGYTDAQVEKMVNDALAQQKQKVMQDHAKAIQKAQHFLDDNYDFTDKSTEQIMRDAVATQSTEQYSDQELPLAFKMLQLPERESVVNFGDRLPEAGQKLKDLENKEL